MFLLAVVFPAVAGASALPDGRAYELVTPPNPGPGSLNATPIGQVEGIDCFETNLVTPDGERVTFASEGASMEGFQSNGSLNLYEAHRTESGWVTESKSASALQTTYPQAGLCVSDDHQYSTLLTGGAPLDRGSLVIDGQPTSYLRTPSGSYEPVGIGTSGTDPSANIRWISPGGSHVILTAMKQLEPEAPTGVQSVTDYELRLAVNAVYDRTPAGLKVVSLLPNGSAPTSSTEATFYRAVSADGASVVFEVAQTESNGSLKGATLYVHPPSGPTVPVVTSTKAGDNRYEAISADGEKIIYIRKGPSSPPNVIRGDIFSFDVSSQTTTPITAGDEAAVVNVSRDGSTVYFTSSEAIPGTGKNSLEESAQPGIPNLYVWNGGQTRFVAPVGEGDVEEILSGGGENLTEWIRAVAQEQQRPESGRANATSRSTPDGSVLVFQASGNVTGFDSNGHTEIYRYARGGGDLTCLSCPNGAPQTDAFLQHFLVGSLFSVWNPIHIANVSDNGEKVFFMTGEPLVSGDGNEAVDVYEWHSGIVSLISAGTTQWPSVLYGMSPSGSDVFFITSDRLVPQDLSEVPSIYDAREGGGFPAPPPPPPPCELDLEQCQGSPTAPPPGGTPLSSSFVGPPNPPIRRKPHCRRSGKGNHRHRHGHRCKGAHSRPKKGVR